MGILELRRQLLFNTPHIETAEGSIVQFDGDFSSKLKNCKVNFLPIQEGTGEPSPENIRNIIGWSNFRLYWNHSINLIPLEFPNDSFYGNFSTGSTSIASASNTKCWSIYVGKNQDIYYQREAIGHTLRLAFADTHLTERTGAVIYNAITMNNRDNQVANSGEHPYLILASAKSSMTKGGSIDVDKVMLSLGDTEKPYQRRSSADNVLINLPKEGLVYGGYVDVSKGELVVDMQYEQLTSEYLSKIQSGYIGYTPSVTALNNSPAIWIRNLFSNAKSRKSGGIKAFCNMFEILMNSTSVSSSQNRTAFKIDGVNISSVEDFIEAIATAEQNGNKLFVAYELNTPIVYQLTPQQIKTFKGTNTVWADTNGDISVEYWTHKS